MMNHVRRWFGSTPEAGGPFAQAGSKALDRARPQIPKGVLTLRGATLGKEAA